MNEIEVEVEAGVMVCTLRRPEKKNALTVSMYKQLAEAFERADAANDVRALLLQGDKEVFCAGNDLEDFRVRADEVQPIGRRFGEALLRFTKPLLAAVCGRAVGIGATMLLHFDIVYAGENAKLSFPFVGLGLVPEAASTVLLPRMIGYHRAAAAFFGGGSIEAGVAADIGLVNKVVPVETCFESALAEARRIAKQPLVSLVETKRLMKLEQMPLVERQKVEEGQVFDRLLEGPAAREAFAAFAERRAPDFRDC